MYSGSPWQEEFKENASDVDDDELEREQAAGLPYQPPPAHSTRARLNAPGQEQDGMHPGPGPTSAGGKHQAASSAPAECRLLFI